MVFSLLEIESEEIDQKLGQNQLTLEKLTGLKAGSPDAYSLQVYKLTTGDSSDTTGVVDVENLKPDTRYRYLLWSEERAMPVLGHQRPLIFKTFSDRVKPISFGFFSCHMPYKTTLFGRTKAVNEEMWDYFGEMLKRHNEKDLRFVLAGGDQVYSDGVETLSIWNFLKKVMRRDGDTLFPEVGEMVSWYRDIYRGYWGFPSFCTWLLPPYPTSASSHRSCRRQSRGVWCTTPGYGRTYGRDSPA